MTDEMQKILETGPNTLLIVRAKDLQQFALDCAKKTINEFVTLRRKADEEDQEKYYTANEVCKMLKVSLPTLWRWANTGYLVPTMMGSGFRKKRLYHQADVEKILENQ